MSMHKSPTGLHSKKKTAKNSYFLSDHQPQFAGMAGAPIGVFWILYFTLCCVQSSSFKTCLKGFSRENQSDQTHDFFKYQ